MGVSLTAPVLLTIFIVITLASAIHGSVGYGINIMAGPILAIFEPRLAPGPLLVAGFLITLLVLLREKRGIDLRGLSWLYVGRLLGTALASVVLVAITGKTLALVFGGIVLLAVWMSLTGLRLTPNRPVKLFVGTLSGIMGTLGAIGGPPAALLYQDKVGGDLRSTLSGFFVFGTTISLSALFAAGKFGQTELILSLAVLPGVLAGFFLSPFLIRLLKGGRTRHVVLGLSGLAGAVLIVQTLLAS